jgi:PBSX family phage terminase large subunit
MTSEVRISELLGDAFREFHHDVRDHRYTHFWLAGGRGSLKSTAASIELIMMLVRNPGVNAVVLRKVAKTMRKSIYAQVVWSINALGQADRFRSTLSPMEITYLPTGQKIVFEGLDQPEKLKSLKFETGYCGVVWYEEIDQFHGMEEVRSVNQSLLRGGDRFWCFYSFNPPRSRNNWVNNLLRGSLSDSWTVHRSTYLDAPPEWIGQTFIDEAEELRELDEMAYRHEYLGEEVGTGGNVFENVEVREIETDEIETFGRVYNGVDWGWFPDPWCFGRQAYLPAQRTLYISRTLHGVKLSDEATADMIKAELGDRRETVICDSADGKAVDKYRWLGLDARRALKGPGSVEHGVKWLASRMRIVIDPKAAPLAAKEFPAYEHERLPTGEYVSSYPDEHNHSIDQCRYALEPVTRLRSSV